MKYEEIKQDLFKVSDMKYVSDKLEEIYEGIENKLD